jgi:hypothetical protein
VQKAYDENGVPIEKELTDKQAKTFWMNSSGAWKPGKEWKGNNKFRIQSFIHCKIGGISTRVRFPGFRPWRCRGTALT